MEANTDTPKRKWRLDIQSGPSSFLEEIEMVVRIVGLDDIAPGRHSALFALTIFGEFKSGRLNLFRLKQEITELESGAANGMKPPIQNRHQPLKGLWHKHYMQGDLASMALNIKRGLDQYGMPHFQQMIREAEAAKEMRYVSPKDVPHIVKDVVEGNWNRLKNDEKITGEWVLFAKLNGQNYYLALATHDKSTHQKIRDYIDAICCREFPFLVDILNG